MTAATTLIDQPDHTDHTVPGRLGLTDRLGGVGGLMFVAILVTQNVLRANAPSFDATPAKVTTYFMHHRAAALIPLGLFPFGMVAIFAFVATVWARAESAESRRWANLGALGATAIAALFALVNITEIVLTAKAELFATAASASAVEALWAMRAGAFGLDLAAIAVTLIGLSRAATATDLVRPWVGTVALPGAACLFTASVCTVGLANGGPWLGVALIGFVAWGVFVVTASLALLRQTGRHVR